MFYPTIIDIRRGDFLRAIWLGLPLQLVLVNVGPTSVSPPVEPTSLHLAFSGDQTIGDGWVQLHVVGFGFRELIVLMSGN